MADEKIGHRPPPDLESKQAKSIIASIEAGNYIETACLAAGIPQRTFYNWRKNGQEGKEPYATFWQYCARARAIAEQRNLEKAIAGDEKGVSYGPSKAAAWLLERTRPDKFAARLKLSLEKKLDEILGIAERVLEPDQYAKLIEAISAAESCSEEACEAADPEG